MEIIATHLNADFDAVGSMLAARKLYPGAHLVMPGGQERSMREFFIGSALYSLDVERIRDIPLEKVKRLVLVDTRQRGRIGDLAALADRDDVEIHIYDHHPPSEDDLKGDLEVIETTGSTVAIMTRILRERGLEPSAQEATIMSMGIYEDTGSLTFPAVTEADYLAAAFLLSKGADLNVVSDLMTRTLTSQQIFVLNDMIRSAATYTIHDKPVTVTEATVKEYMDDLAILVHRLVDMENLPAVCSLFRMEDRIYLICRSRLPEVDAGLVARHLGGGGHPHASSATLKDMTLIQAREQLVDTLHATVKPSRISTEIMTRPVKTVRTTDTLETAREMLTRYNINVLPVVHKGRIKGIITRQIVEKAAFHGMADQPVESFMQREFKKVKPDTPLSEVFGIIVSDTQKLIPVVDRGRPVGVFTRTDFLRHLRDEKTSSPRGLYNGAAKEKPVLRKDVIHTMKESIPPEILSVVKDIGKAAHALGFRAFLVGGFVRDLLLRYENLDVDVVVEGDGIRVAQSFCEAHRCRVRPHREFGTAVIVFPDGFKVDVATARLEYYRSPAALPTVEASSIKLDMYRRDFTINTLIVRIDPGNFGELVDFFGAYRDLKDGVLRVLHNLSFIEDPTRILRAVRFEQRFGFEIGATTLKLIDNAVRLKLIEKLSGKRLFNELKLILQESDPLACIFRMKQTGILSQIHSKIRLPARNEKILANVREVISWWRLQFIKDRCETWMLYLYGLIAYFRPEDLEDFCKRMAIVGRLKRKIVEDKADAEKAIYRLSRLSRPSPSTVYRELQGASTEALLFAMAKTYRESTKKALSAYLSRLRSTKTRIGGKDLMKLGIPPGPLYGEILEKVLEARLNGKVGTKKDELALARRLAPKAASAGAS